MGIYYSLSKMAAQSKKDIIVEKNEITTTTPKREDQKPISQKTGPYKEYSQKSTYEALNTLSVTSNGLSEDEIESRLLQYGKNEITSKSETALNILIRQFKTTLTYLLIFAALISYFLGEKIDAITIFFVLTFNGILGFIQEYRSFKAVEKLKKLITDRAMVKRDGKTIVVERSNLVPGDIVLLKEGDIVPADLRILKSENLQINESILTGEPFPTRKTQDLISSPIETVTEAQNIAFTGTTVVGGSGEGLVIATGSKAVFGEVAKLTIETQRPSSFEEYIKSFSSLIFKFALITICIMFFGNIIIKGSSVNIVELLIFTIALVVGIIPEPLPVVTALTFSKGALDLAKKKVVVKRLSALEDFGNIEILATDKTGTITENNLCVKNHYGGNFHSALLFALLGAGIYDVEKNIYTDSFDDALSKAANEEIQDDLKKYSRIWERPFDPKLRTNSAVVSNGSTKYLIVRGAPEEVIKICQKDLFNIKEAQNWCKETGLRGERILAIAYKEITQKTSYSLEDEKHLIFSGAVSFEDPIKETTRETIQKAKKLGLVIKILTGDSPEVAHTVGTETGIIKKEEKVLTGVEFEKLSEKEQEKAAENTTIFARVSPEQKYKIIQYLQVKHHVGFLGEGINDAPALKLANVAIVVDHASDVAREAADIILLEKDLKVIVDGISEGRAIFSNIAKYTKITLVSNFGNFFAIAAVSAVIDFLPMLPTQILLVNLLSDFPMISIATDNVDAVELKRPKKYDLHELFTLEIFLGTISTLFDFLYFGLFFRAPHMIFQTLWFMESITSEVFLIFSLRTKLSIFKARPPSKLLATLGIMGVLLTIAIPYSPFASVFHFAQPPLVSVLIVIAIVLVYFVVTETVKLIYYRHEINK